MILIKYNNSEEFLEVAFKRVDENTVKVTFAKDAVIGKEGFCTYTTAGKKLGYFTDYTTVSYKTANSVWYSNTPALFDSNPDEKGKENLYVPPKMSLEDVKRTLINSVQIFMDEVAIEKGYDSILAACSYINTGIKKFDDEGAKARTWRSLLWEKVFNKLETYKDIESISALTTEDLLKELPKIEW